MLIYVDDIFITSNKQSAIDDLLSTLHHDFAVKNLDPSHFFLRVKILPNSKGFILSQHRYIIDILKRTNMLEAKLVGSPMAPST